MEEDILELKTVRDQIKYQHEWNKQLGHGKSWAIELKSLNKIINKWDTSHQTAKQPKTKQ